jgi:3-oxoadipate enol-lactonase
MTELEPIVGHYLPVSFDGLAYRVFVEEAGAGMPLLCLHTAGADSRQYRHLLNDPEVTRRFRVVAFDLPGFGDAVPAPGPQAPWDDVLEAMDALGIEQAALVGNSFGAAVALRVAKVAPSRVSGLVLISVPPPGLEPSAELEGAWAAEEAALERGDLEAAVDAVLDAWTLPDAPASLTERVSAMQRRSLALQADAASVSEAPDPIGDDLGALATIDVPALVIAGDREFPDFVRGAELVAGALPRARHAVIEGAGHLAPLETPEALRALLLEFLSE